MQVRRGRLGVVLGLVLGLVGLLVWGSGPVARAAERVVPTAVAYAPDGGTVAIGSAAGSVFIHDARNGRLLRTLSGHGRVPITAVEFSPDGTILASGGRDSTVRLWATRDGAEVRVLRGQEQAVRALAFTPDGAQLLVGGEDTRAMLWEMASGTLARVFPGASDFVTAVAVNRDGTFAVADRAGRITLRSPAGDVIGTLRGHTGEITDVAFSPDATTLASSSSDRTIKLWDVAARQQRQSLVGHTDTVSALAFSPDGASVTSGGRDGSVRFWDARSGAPGRVVSDSRDPVVGLAVSPDGRSLVDARSTGAVRTRDTGTGRATQTFALADEVTATAPTQPFQAQSVDPALTTGPGGPVLLITSNADPFSLYYAEILRAEGLTSFASVDVGSVTAATLAQHDVVLLAARPINSALVTLLTDWVTAGGNLVAMRPDPQLAGLLGLTPASGTLAEGYLLVDTTTRPGSGIVGQTIQFHGTADRYTLSGARAVATLYATATTATSNPAVSLRAVGDQGGQAAAFTYDLARSVVLTRQGNPAWAGRERDGISPVRSDDQFYGAAAGDAQPDWVDLAKVAIPQADEQQRLLVNLVLEMNADRTPLPRFWYLPSGKKAAIVMTGDDHGNGGTIGRFDQLLAESPPGCSVADWECIRGTSYVYPNTPLTNAQASAYVNQGFELGVHVNTNCQDWTADSLTADYARDLQAFAAKYTSVPAPRTNRTHCIAWSEWSTQAAVERNNNIRFDTNYYYWPPSWIQDRAGMFTGSGFPMRFTDPTGQMIDVYQATTQLTDESGQTYPGSVDTLLDRALGPEGYYGAFTINAHTDVGQIPESTTTVASAKARGVPVVSAAQMLTWLDGRNSSSFQNVQWAGGQLSFTVVPGAGARNLDMLVPARSGPNALVSVTRDGTPVPLDVQTIKGGQYAFLRADAGAYVATYAADTSAPVVTSVGPADAATGIRQSDPVTATFNEALDPATVNGNTFELRGPGDAVVQAAVSYDAGTRTARLVPNAALAANTLYRATIRGGTTEPTVRDAFGNPLDADRVWSFTTAAGPACPCSLWPATSEPVNKVDQDPNPVELGVKFRSDVAGFVTGVRFWKGTPNTGTHVGSLWTTSGQRLANATFTNETASGWQQVTFPTPVAVTANTTYVASYHTTSGMYAGDTGFFNTGVDTPPLHAPSSGSSGGNGVYAYASTPTFPNNTWQSTNYWVDVVFTTSTGPDTTPPQVLTVNPADGATGVATNTEITAGFNEALDPATVSGSTATLTGPGGTPVSATVSYRASTTSVVLLPTAALAPQTAYTVRLAGGTSSPRITDTAGNALAADRSWTFTTGAPGPCDTAPNEIVAENCKPGSPASEWDISGAGDLSLQGFATDLSVDQGGTVQFKIDSTGGAAYGIDIYRLGYYGGLGARKVDSIPQAGITATDQPNCTSTAIANQPGRLVDCANWSVSASWPVPATATSGLYLARLTRASGAASHIVFVVRDDDGNSDLLFQTSDTTWQAYNPYGGYNTYNTGSTGVASVKVSYNRPFTTRGGQLEDWLFNSEFPALRWLERNGYDVSYTTHGDVGRRPAEVREHRAFLSVGHDEYWSQEARDAVTAARDAGVHQAFLSGNEVYWKIRWEDSVPDPRTDDQRTMVVYKEGSAAGSAEHYACFNNYQCDPSDVWTGLWREAQGSTPENSLTAQISWRDSTAGITVPGQYAPLRFWRNTDVAGLGPSGSVSLPSGLLGYEWNHWQQQYADHYPAGRVRLSTTTVGSDQHHLAIYRAPSGALVFGAGTVQWSWGLDAVHDRGTNIENRTVQQATLNLLADMGAQPATRQSNLTAASTTTDTTAAVAVITSPAEGATIAPGSTVSITGTASDQGGQVAGVEVSTNGGATWRPATGGATWSFTWTAPAVGPVTLLARAVDDSANLQPTPASRTVQIGTGTPPPTTPPPTTPPPTTPPPTTPPPSAPTGLTATAGAAGVTLDWGDVQGAAGYHVYRATADTGPFLRVTGPASARSDWVDTLAPAGTSVYRVTALSSDGVESAPSATASAVAAKANLLVNPSFEIDANTDGRPDSWTSSARFTRVPEAARSGEFGGRHRATNNAGYTVAQTVQGITPGTSYAMAGSARVQPTTDGSFSVAFRVQWLDNRNRVLSTDNVGAVDAATPRGEWQPISRTLTAPTGATRAAVQMVVVSLNATVDVDDVVLR